MNPASMTNEQLCALAQKGDAHAADLLLEHNSGFIRKTASEIFLRSNLAESDLSIEPGDLEQEGCIGLDFAKQNRVPTGMLRAPIGNPAAKRCSLCNPSFSSRVHIQTAKGSLSCLL